jgi:hypothetical protein
MPVVFWTPSCSYLFVWGVVWGETSSAAYWVHPYTTVAMGSNTAIVDLTLKVDNLSPWIWSGPDLWLPGPPRTETDTHCWNHTAPVLIKRTSAQTRLSCLSVDQRTCSAVRLQADRNTQLAAACKMKLATMIALLAVVGGFRLI